MYSLWFTSYHNQINGASLQDNSQLRYILYTSSVQDLYFPLRFLPPETILCFLSRLMPWGYQSIMISFFILLAPSNTLVSFLYPRACICLYRLLNQSIPEQQWALFNIGLTVSNKSKKWWSCGQRSNGICTHEHPVEVSMYGCLWGLCSQYKDRKYRTTLSIGSSCRKQILMVWRDIQCYPLTLTTRKQCNKRNGIQ